jgi:hypothetical protein
MLSNLVYTACDPSGSSTIKVTLKHLTLQGAVYDDVGESNNTQSYADYFGNDQATPKYAFIIDIPEDKTDYSIWFNKSAMPFPKGGDTVQGNAIILPIIKTKKRAQLYGAFKLNYVVENAETGYDDQLFEFLKDNLYVLDGIVYDGSNNNPEDYIVDKEVLSESTEELKINKDKGTFSFYGKDNVEGEGNRIGAQWPVTSKGNPITGFETRLASTDHPYYKDDYYRNCLIKSSVPYKTFLHIEGFERLQYTYGYSVAANGNYSGTLTVFSKNTDNYSDNTYSTQGLRYMYDDYKQLERKVGEKAKFYVHYLGEQFFTRIQDTVKIKNLNGVGVGSINAKLYPMIFCWENHATA